MEKFQVRDNYNGRLINFGMREFDDVYEAMRYASAQQEKHNKRFREWKPRPYRRGPCPTVELLQLVWVGMPERAPKKAQSAPGVAK